MGFDSSVEFRPVHGSPYTAAQLLLTEPDEYEAGAWKVIGRGRTAQGDYSGPTVSLPAAGAMFRVKLTRY